MAGHIGFELRCAERKFISLRRRWSSVLRTPGQTVANSQGNNLLCLTRGHTPAVALMEPRTARSGFSRSKFESCDRGSLDTNSDAQREDAAASGRVGVAHALHDPGMIARR
jgi:hypothetical protein